MSKVPSLNYDKVIKALKRDGWVVVRQKGVILDCINIQEIKN